MAKVVGPLQSFSAGGKVADTLIFQKSNGRNIVRRYFRPSNPNSSAQQVNRTIMFMVSQAIGAVDPDRPYLQDLLTVVPATETWSTYIQKYVTRRFGRGLAGADALRLDYVGHPNRVLINDFSIRIEFTGRRFTTDPSDPVLDAGVSFYLLAELAFELKTRDSNLFDRAVYNTPLDSWNLNHAIDFKTDFTDRIPRT